MTKADREEFDTRFRAYEKANYYGALAMKQCMEYKILSKREALDSLREKQG